MIENEQDRAELEVDVTETPEQEPGLLQAAERHPDVGAQGKCAHVCVQYADVSVPIKLNPYTNVGCVKVECCGAPEVVCRVKPECSKNKGCEFTITQTMCVRIPVEFGAVATVGDTIVECGKCGGCDHCKK